MKKVTEVTMEVDGIPKNFNQGEINIIFDSWTTTDMAERWNQKAWFFFLRTIIDKLIYKFPMDEAFYGEGAADVNYIYNQVRSHMGLYKFKLKEAEMISK